MMHKARHGKAARNVGDKNDSGHTYQAHDALPCARQVLADRISAEVVKIRADLHRHASSVPGPAQGLQD